MFIVVDFGGSVDTSVRGGVREAQDAVLRACSLPVPASGLMYCHNQHFRPHPLDLGLEMGVVRLLAPPLTSLMWLDVVSSMCHTPS